jgi:hypothetical protein
MTDDRVSEGLATCPVCRGYKADINQRLCTICQERYGSCADCGTTKVTVRSAVEAHSAGDAYVLCGLCRADPAAGRSDE